jgi:EAL domain-containing protein (putative c-di-GMP-specific phosphodiesterase class I)
VRACSQSFVREIDADTDNSTIISSVTNVGRNLKHRVIAEGVEARHADVSRILVVPK